jgi:murein DD-endopeptidase MepM/ murein hydrolase activator NlpD
MHERMVAMLAIGFCLGALATTYLVWRRDALTSLRDNGASPSARGGASSAPPMVPGPTVEDIAAPLESEVVATVPAVGPATTAPEAPVAPGLEGTDLEILQQRRLRIPIDGVAHAALQPGFDQVRGEGRHEAIDILAPRGTPVHAVEAGIVGKLFTSVRGGITLYQYDPSGRFCYYYAHLDKYAEGLREGQALRAGDLVGYVGTTGNAPKDTPHLHFAIFRLTEPGRWWKGTAIDPYLALR